MPSALPVGDPAPLDGSLPEASLAAAADTPLGIYLHVPFCRTRCGYCDFNTYTASELGTGHGASRDTYMDAALAELDLAARVLGDRVPEVSTVFVGGGTPTLLPLDDLGRLLREVEDRFGLAADAEITTESNPESIDATGLQRLVDHGFNRVSFGMQSAVPHVLTVLDRTHSPGRPEQAVAEARAAGFAHVSLDLIFGTPGESLADWETSLRAAVAAEVDHVSAYSLIVEEGTKLAVRVRRGELPMTDEDDLADKYLLAEEILTGAGFEAYEVSNWATSTDARCQHNLAYWRGTNWWGIGPGAHSHVGGTRWWNVKHPAAYAARLAEAQSPVHSREVLSDEDRRVERVLLELRIADGLDRTLLTATETSRLPDFAARGLVTLDEDRIHLTLQGRLLADGVVRDLLDCPGPLTHGLRTLARAVARARVGKPCVSRHSGAGPVAIEGCPDPIGQLVGLLEIRPRPTDHLPAEVSESVLAHLLPEDDVARILLATQFAVLDLAVELAEGAMLLPAEVGTSDHGARVVTYDELQVTGA